MSGANGEITPAKSRRNKSPRFVKNWQAIPNRTPSTISWLHRMKTFRAAPLRPETRRLNQAKPKSQRHQSNLECAPHSKVQTLLALHITRSHRPIIRPCVLASDRSDRQFGAG